MASRPVKYVVVLMLENRSFDNMLSALTGTPAAQSNPNPNPPPATYPNANQATPTQVDGTGTSYAATTIPVIDPGEFFGDMAQQIITGSQGIPSSNPYTNYEQSQATMQGFIDNYSSPDRAQGPNVPDVMNYFTPAQIPVTAFLANNYAVCESWYASVPTQTFPNRAFALCAAPNITGGSDNDYYSLIDDVQYADTPVETPSLLSQLDAVLGGKVNWKVYFHDYSITMDTVPYVSGIGASSSNMNVATFDTSDWGTNGPTGKNGLLGANPPTFLDDVGATSPTLSVSLAPFSFIEPRYSNTFAPNPFPPNSNHPGGSDDPPTAVSDTNPPIDVVNGELLLALVYDLLQASGVWDETLLIVTYDEHGGTYDHMPPPPATPPGTINWPSSVPNPPFTSVPNADYFLDPASQYFSFNAYGCRVPAIIISPCIQPGLVISVPQGETPYDHTSIISTVFDLFDLATTDVPSLTQRDLNAPSLESFLDSSNDTGLFTGVIPTFLSFSSLSPAPQTLWRIDTSAEHLSAFVNEGSDWLSITQTLNTIGPSLMTLQVIVTVTPGTLGPGTYTGQIQTIGAEEINVTVTLVIA
jgi:phospholipase C